MGQNKIKVKGDESRIFVQGKTGFPNRMILKVKPE